MTGAAESDRDDIVIRAVPPKELNHQQRVKIARVMTDMLRRQGFACMLAIPEEEGGSAGGQ